VVANHENAGLSQNNQPGNRRWQYHKHGNAGSTDSSVVGHGEQQVVTPTAIAIR